MADKFSLITNPFRLLRDKLFQKPVQIKTDVITNRDSLSDDDIRLISTLGMTSSDLKEAMDKAVHINMERNNLYREFERSLSHPIMSSALELYADYSTVFSRLEGRSIWVTSSNKEYETVLNKMLDKIDIEEKIFDWAWNIGGYGDMFVRVNAIPGIGIVSIEDNDHPSNISRVDYNGRLIGFYTTPMGSTQDTGGAENLIPPWEIVHFRLLGAKKKRPLLPDSSYTEYRTISLISPDLQQLSSKYGTSLLLNGLAPYKRLRLAEDSVMLARLSKGVKRYIYKVKVTGSNAASVKSILDSYKTTLKRARAINTGDDNPNFDSKYLSLAVNEDIILPVFGEANDVVVEPLGGDADIRWIVDIEELRNQLSSSLRVPLQLLGGWQDETSGPLGGTALDKIDIRFARSCRRLQRANINGVTRLCQIHLAYLNMDPDVNLFKVNMSETSTSEEEELLQGLEKSVNITDQLSDLITKMVGQDVDTEKLYHALNQKILKLTDIDIEKIKGAPKGSDVIQIEKIVEQIMTERKSKTYETKYSDFKSYLPVDTRYEKKIDKVLVECSSDDPNSYPIKYNKKWESLYKNAKVVVKEKK